MAPSSWRGVRAAGVRSRHTSTTRRMCSGVVPQQPPTTWTPSSVMKRRWCSASCVGREVVVHLRRRPPTAGRRWGGRRSACGRAGRGGGGARCISAGPVAQLMPMTSGLIGSRAARAAPISVPGSMRPGELDGDLDLERDLAAPAAMALRGAVHGGLDAEQVELGLDDDQVDAALEQAAALLDVDVAQLCVADLAERRRTWCPGRSSRPRTGGGPGWRTRRRPRGRAGPPSR